jgi:two-component system, chemotaxis family, protein-glutamate methylesterase/glutaminase
MRHLLQAMLGRFPDIKVVGTAADPFVAREKIKELRPDVVTLDIEMPRMNGLAFLERLMRLKPMPVVMVSSLAEQDAEPTLRALELGAVDFIAKPKSVSSESLNVYAEELANKLRAAAATDVTRLEGGNATWFSRTRPEPSGLQLDAAKLSGKVIVIGASTGGTEAIREVLVKMPENVPPIFVVQHMPEFFTGMFARRLDQTCRISVAEAQNEQVASPGAAYIAPGHSHLEIVRRGHQYVMRLNQGALINRHRPSVDALFQSAAQVAQADAIGVLLTGMGTDGAAGMLALREAGAYTIAQDEKSSVIFGMPRAAIAMGGAKEVLSVQRIGERILKLLSGGFASAGANA